MKHSQYFQLGQISKSHGVRGEVLALIDVDHPQQYENLKSVFIEQNTKLIPFFIEKIDILKDKAIIKFEEITDMKAAAALSGSELYLPLNNLPELEDGHFYYHDIKGFAVEDSNLGELGTVLDVYELPGHDIIAMDYKSSEVLIPIQPHIVLRADLKKQILYVELPEGLLEIYLQKGNDTPDDADEE